MNEKKLIILLSVVIFVIISAAIFFIVAISVLIPSEIVAVFGPPDPALDNSSRILYSAKLYLNKEALKTPFSPIGQNRIFSIDTGSSAKDVVDDLANAQLIKDPKTFIDYLVYKGIDRQLQAGTYVLNPLFTPIEIAALLHDTTPEDIAFSFLAGWRAEEIAALLPTSGLNISPDEFMDLIKNPPLNFADIIKPNLKSFEGYLFPDNYQILKSATAEELIKQFLFNFRNKLPINYESSLQKVNLDLNQAVILASIIEKETILPDEAPLIASVFINRMNAGMPLQSDPTVQYAIGYYEEQKSWWKNPLSSSDLSVNSPFNTYINKGLPPTPICNPSLVSIMAIMEPADTDFLFFRAACDGTGRHIFNIHFEDHLKAECK